MPSSSRKPNGNGHPITKRKNGNGKKKNGNGRRRHHNGIPKATSAERAAAHAVIRSALVEDAHRNPWRLFTAEHIADIMGVSVDLILAVKKQKDSPFPANKSRPEWVLEWLQRNPGFQIKTS